MLLIRKLHRSDTECIREFYKTLFKKHEHTIIKLIEKKKDNDERFIQNWRSISLLNVYLKTISETLSEKLKKTLLDSIPSQQTTYFKKDISW